MTPMEACLQQIMTSISTSKRQRYTLIQRAAGTGVIGGIIGEESEWKDIQFAMRDPEPEYDPTDYWLRGNRDTDRRLPD